MIEVLVGIAVAVGLFGFFGLVLMLLYSLGDIAKRFGPLSKPQRFWLNSLLLIPAALIGALAIGTGEIPQIFGAGPTLTGPVVRVIGGVVILVVAYSIYSAYRNPVHSLGNGRSRKQEAEQIGADNSGQPRG